MRLRGQAAAGLLDSADGEAFELSPEGAAVLADEQGSLFFAGVILDFLRIWLQDYGNPGLVLEQ